MKSLNNVSYKGVFTGSDVEKYNELSVYDVLLLPTRWKNEGVPGILVEAKIAGLAEIVSSQNYNAEIVTDGEDGVVLRDNSIDSLRKAILTLSEDNKLLDSMKYKSWMS